MKNTTSTKIFPLDVFWWIPVKESISFDTRRGKRAVILPGYKVLNAGQTGRSRYHARLLTQVH